MARPILMTKIWRTDAKLSGRTISDPSQSNRFHSHVQHRRIRSFQISGEFIPCRCTPAVYNSTPSPITPFTDQGDARMNLKKLRCCTSANKPLMTALLLLVGICMTPVSNAAPPDGHWPQWRGPTRDCRVTGPTWPNSLQGDHLRELWRNDMGPSYSGPIVIGDRVFTTETQDKKNEVVRALDRKTGKEIWQASWPGSLTVPFFASANGSWIRATPAFDKGRLYVAGIRDVLVCLNAEDGKELWRLDLAKHFKSSAPSFGFASSPLIDKNHVYVQAGGGFVKVEKETGKVVWKSLADGGGTFGSAFSSPALATINGKRQAVVQTRKRLAGIDLESGNELWSQDVPAFRGMNILTPTIVNNSVFTSSYGGGSFFYNLQASESSSAVKQLWRNKVQGYMSSPVVIDGFLYLHLRNKRFACIELSTGKERWITTPFGGYWSMAVQDDRILALDERGDLLLIKANPEKFDLIDKRHISDDPTWAHLAVSNGEVFIRTLKSQIAFSWK